MKNQYFNIALLMIASMAISCTSKNGINAEKEKVGMSEIGVSLNDSVFMKVDYQPEFSGGVDLFYDFIQENLKYPEMAKQKGVEGKVYVEFVITKHGKVEGVSVLKGIGSGCDKAATDLIKSMPEWMPGVQDNKAVNVKMVLPISFKLS